MSGVKGTVKQGDKQFNFIEISSGTNRGIQVTEEGTKSKDATHTYYCYFEMKKDGKLKLFNIHEMADYNKHQTKFYSELAQALAKKAVTQGKWPADGWAFTYDGHQIKLYHNTR